MSVTLMDIEYKDVPELMRIFKGFFPSHMHIKFLWQKTRAQITKDRTAVVTVINVKINDTKDGGEGEENWTLEYAYNILKHPKEMELCAKRWLDSFKNKKKKATLDLPGYIKPTIN